MVSNSTVCILWLQTILYGTTVVRHFAADAPMALSIAMCLEATLRWRHTVVSLRVVVPHKLYCCTRCATALVLVCWPSRTLTSLAGSMASCHDVDVTPPCHDVTAFCD